MHRAQVRKGTDIPTTLTKIENRKFRPIPSSVRQHLCGLDVSLDDYQIEMLARYLDRLLETNRHINLTAVRDRDLAWHRLIVDSLTLIPFLEQIPSDSRLIDLGTGGGLPGIPVAVACPQFKVTLLEATAKKARFCADCVKSLAFANINVVNDRVETIGHEPLHRAQYDVALCRAVGRMATVLEYAMPLLRVGGKIMAIKGPSAEAELEQASNAMDQLGAGQLMVFDAYPDGFDQDTVIVLLTKETETPSIYPRRPGIPRKTPL